MTAELSKTNFTDYVRALADCRLRNTAVQRRATTFSITARDETKFAGYFEANPRRWSVWSADDAGLRRRTALCGAGRPRQGPRKLPDWRLWG